MMISIDVDLDVYKALSGRKASEGETYNSVLRSVLDLKSRPLEAQEVFVPGVSAEQAKQEAAAAAAAGEKPEPRVAPTNGAKLKVAVLGAAGNIGPIVVDEALSRGFEVTALARDPSKIAARPGVTAKAADANDPASLAEALKGADALLVAVRWGYADVNKLLEGVRASGVKRVVLAVGCGALMRADGRRHFIHASENNGVPAPAVVPAVRVVEALRNAADLEWTAVSCPMDIRSGERLGQYRLGGEHMIFDKEGRSRISSEDFAVAMVDEAQESRHVRQQVGAAY